MNISIPMKERNATFHIVKDTDGLMRTYLEAEAHLPFNSFDERAKFKEVATGEGLAKAVKHENLEIREYARNVLDEAKRFIAALKKANYKKFDYKSGDVSVFITPCVSGMNPPKTITDIEYYLANDNIIYGTDSIYELAERVVMYDKYLEREEADKNKLMDFYVKEVRPLLGKSYDDMTMDERSTMGNYSDWHKDLYGFRPRNGWDKCEESYEESLESEEEMA